MSEGGNVMNKADFPTDQQTFLRQIVGDKGLLRVANLIDCQNLLSTGLLQVVPTSCKKSAKDKLQQA